MTRALVFAFVAATLVVMRESARRARISREYVDLNRIRREGW